MNTWTYGLQNGFPKMSNFKVYHLQYFSPKEVNYWLKTICDFVSLK